MGIPLLSGETFYEGIHVGPLLITSALNPGFQQCKNCYVFPKFSEVVGRHARTHTTYTRTHVETFCVLTKLCDITFITSQIVDDENFNSTNTTSYLLATLRGTPVNKSPLLFSAILMRLIKSFLI